MPLITTANQSVHGQYSRNGYEVWLGNHLAYSAGNHIQDSSQPALCEKDRLRLKTTRRFCIKTAHEIATESHGRFAGVELVAEEGDAG